MAVIKAHAVQMLDFLGRLPSPPALRQLSNPRHTWKGNHGGVLIAEGLALSCERTACHRPICGGAHRRGKPEATRVRSLFSPVDGTPQSPRREICGLIISVRGAGQMSDENGSGPASFCDFQGAPRRDPSNQSSQPSGLAGSLAALSRVRRRPRSIGRRPRIWRGMRRGTGPAWSGRPRRAGGRDRMANRPQKQRDAKL